MPPHLVSMLDATDTATQTQPEPTPTDLVIDVVAQINPRTVIALGLSEDLIKVLNTALDVKVWCIDWRPDPDLLSKLTFAHPNLHVYVNNYKRIAGYDSQLPNEVDLVLLDGSTSFDVNSTALDFLTPRFTKSTVLIVSKESNVINWLTAAGWTDTAIDLKYSVFSKAVSL